MLGYKPLLIGLNTNQIKIDENFPSGKEITLYLGLNEHDIFAKLRLKVFRKINLSAAELFILEGTAGNSKFKNSFQKFLSDFYYRLTADKDKNIFLKGNLYEQVKVAYSVPRKIYLISLGENGMFNIFPTDISGKINEDYFAVSLRTNSNATRQLESVGKCVIAEMQSDTYTEVYALGKNHMSDLTAADSIAIELRTERSEKFNLPIPKKTIKYYELERDSKIEAGLHSIHFLKIKNSVKLNDEKSTLAHIHRDYAEWRIKNNLQTDFLFR
jgi:flavin reductase (DIM6/NTAB) family NADH-FMN oxidoreductase RutF